MFARGRKFLKRQKISIWYYITLSIVSFFLIPHTYTSPVALSCSMAFILLHLYLFQFKSPVVIRYVFAYLSIVLFILALTLASPEFSQITQYVYNVPLLYAFLLTDLFTPSMAGLGIIYIFYSYMDEIGLNVFKATSISMITASVGYTMILYLLRRLTNERNRYHQLSIRDPLTGLYNLKYLLDEGESILAQKTITLMVIDIDHFKKVNDNFGHSFGNMLLIEIANLLNQRFNYPGCIVSRLGGDEFILLVQESKDDQFKTLADEILGKILNNFPEQKERLLEIKIGFSVGILHSSDYPNKSINELLQIGDQLMYQEKNRRKKQR